MRQKSGPHRPGEKHVKGIRRATRKQYSMKEMIRIVLEGLHGEYSIAELRRRFIGCNKQIRAKPFKRCSEGYLALELYLAWKGSGLPVETPAIRN